jgi:hypothetical protein
MARAAQKDILSRLADAGEAAMKTLGDAPGADRFLGAANALRDRLDELQKRVRGLEDLEQRLAALERKVDRLGKGDSAPRTVARKTTSTKSSGAGARKKT